MPSISQVIGIIIGFVISAITTPIAMNYLAAVNNTFNGTSNAANIATYAPVFTVFSVLLPVLYMIGVAIYFIPRGGK